jgi:prepilin-type N-terminal cleavage/methylation domain-containing protein
MHRTRAAFTIIELLVVVSIIALLVGILLPAIGKARDQARMTMSQANLRNLAAAHGSYAAEWGDRQLTFCNDSASRYGVLGDWYANYADEHGSEGGWWDAGNHPPVSLGWGRRTEGGGYTHFFYSCVMTGNASLTFPIVFESASLRYFGSFRFINAEQFNQYVSGRFYDPVFYAPKDVVVNDAASACFESPDSFCVFTDVDSRLGDIPAWASYVLSPAAMFNVDVMRHDDPEDGWANGWRSPWEMKAGFKSPSFSQARYPNLKTHMLEHHWLQNPMADCNPGFEPGTYGSEGCEPYYFNHAWESSPVTLFYDGHVENIGVRNTMRADGRVRQQTGNENWGLWSKDTTYGEDGYLIEYGYDQAATSFHILTTGGILGRDILGD